MKTLPLDGGPGFDPGPEGGEPHVRPYETMIIFDAELEETAITGVLDRATEIIRSSGGERGPLDRWGKRSFAYELKHKREGYYVVMEFTAEPAAAAEIDRLLVLADEVLRHKTMHLPDKIKGLSHRSPQKPDKKSSPAPTTEAAAPTAAG